MTPEDAEEYTQAAEQVLSGGWRVALLAERLGVPAALGINVREWQERIGGFVRLSIPERREAVVEMTGEGMTQRQIADVLGVNPSTVNRDAAGVANATAPDHATPLDLLEPEPPVANATPTLVAEEPTERDPSDEERVLVGRCEAGETVVVSMRGHHDFVIAWAEDTPGVLVRIDRRTDWGNPFEIDVDGTRCEVISKYERHYLPHKPRLVADLPNLRGRVLACWCAPDPCHGDVLKRWAER